MSAKLTDRGSRVIAHFCAGEFDPLESAPQSRAAVSTTVSNTGCTSAVERLMTLSTSLVAVWYSSDS
jgi:hypothetical protein